MERWRRARVSIHLHDIIAFLFTYQAAHLGFLPACQEFAGGAWDEDLIIRVEFTRPCLWIVHLLLLFLHLTNIFHHGVVRGWLHLPFSGFWQGTLALLIFLANPLDLCYGPGPMNPIADVLQGVAGSQMAA